MAKTKAVEKDYDQKGFEEAVKLSATLRTRGQEKVALLKKSEDIFLMRWNPAVQMSEYKKAVSPDGKNKVKGAVRLLTATQPNFRVPREKNNQAAEKKSSPIEQLAQTMWMMSDHIQGVKVVRDLALSAFLYDEIILNVICMDDIVSNVQDAFLAATDKWKEKRWAGKLEQVKAQAAMTPYMFEPASPMVVYPQYGRGGATQVYSEVKRLVSDVMLQWGEKAKSAIGNRKDTDFVTECSLVDGTFKYVWLLENSKEPIFADEHGAPMCTTIAVRAEGSRLFEKIVDQYDPFLKTLSESGIWELQNRILTATNTNLSATLDAQWTFTQGHEGDDVEPMFDKFLGMWKLPPGSKVDALIKDVLSKDVVGAMELVRGMIAESTIFDQALGAGTGQKDPFSLVSLLSQAGRLPLIGVQSMLGEALARTMEVTFAWMKAEGTKRKVSAGYGQDLEIASKDIPTVLRFECDVDVDLQQDKLQQANTAKMWKELGVSDEWILSKFGGIENPDQMQKQSFFEMANKMAGMEALKWAMEQMMQVLTAPPPSQTPPQTPPPAPPQAGTLGEGGMMPPPTEGVQGIPPVMAGPQAQQPGMPSQAEMSGELPPEMMGGM